MERSKKILPKFKKIGKGSFKLNNRIIKPGQVFSANPDDIPEAFADLIIPVNEVAKKEVEKTIDAPTFKLKVVNKEKDTWNIINESGKKVNEKPLPREEAEKALEKLEK